MSDKLGNAAFDKVPPRVQALAAQIGDEALAWNEHEDGSIVIVFNMKGKRTFEKSVTPKAQAAPLIEGDGITVTQTTIKSLRKEKQP